MSQPNYPINSEVLVKQYLREQHVPLDEAIVQAKLNLSQADHTDEDADVLIPILAQTIWDMIAKYESKEDSYKFTTDYRIDMILEITGYAVKIFKNKQNERTKEHPIQYMKSLNNSFLTKFYDLIQSTARENAAAVGLAELINKQLRLSLPRKLELHIASEVRAHSICNSKRAFKKHMLIKLLEKKDFDLYKLYLQNVSHSYMYWIEEYVMEHCRKDNNEVLTTSAQNELDKVITAIETAVKNASKSNVHIWLNNF